MLRIVTGELELLADDGITDRELAVAKGNLRAETLLACEDSGARMSRLGSSAAAARRGADRRRGAGPDRRGGSGRGPPGGEALVAAPRTLAAVGPFDADAFDSTALGLAGRAA